MVSYKSTNPITSSSEKLPISAKLEAGTRLLWCVNKRKLLVSDNMVEVIFRRAKGRPSTYGSEF